MAKLGSRGEVTLPQRAAMLWGWRVSAVAIVDGTWNRCPGTLVTTAHLGANMVLWQFSYLAQVRPQ